MSSYLRRLAGKSITSTEENAATGPNETGTLVRLAGYCFSVMIRGNGDELRLAFQRKACIVGHIDGTLEFATLDEFNSSPGMPERVMVHSNTVSSR